MLKILNNSLSTPYECQKMRQNIQRLNMLIGKNTLSELEENEAYQNNHNHSTNLYNQPRKEDTELFKQSNFLGKLFNRQKIEQDDKNLANNDKNHGLYLFLKTFTKGIDQVEFNSSQRTEQQEIDVDEMSTYLSFIER
jgi:hypothetical protein